MKLSTRILIILLSIVVADCLYYMGGNGDGSYYTIIAIIAKYLALFSLIFIARRSSIKGSIPDAFNILFVLFLVSSILAIVRGAFNAMDYWDIKFLIFNSALFMLIPLAFFVGKNINLARLTIYYVLKYLFPYGVLLIPLSYVTSLQVYPRLMMPVSILILFVPYLRLKDRVIIILVATTSVFFLLGFRTNVLKVGFSSFIILLYYFKNYIRLFWWKVACFCIFIAPVLLLYLASTGQYNLFSNLSENESYSMAGSNGGEESWTADTRTLLFIDVFNTLKSNNTWVFGEGAVAKYRTESFDNLVHNGARYETEVGFLNTLLYSGIIGVVLYGGILFCSSFFGMFRSKNYLCKMLSLLIAFRWFTFFLEEFTEFDINFYFLWISIGILMCTKFRNMTDEQLRQFFY
jgi:hypothetical protein